jgi:hypothetical protein
MFKTFAFRRSGLVGAVTAAAFLMIAGLASMGPGGLTTRASNDCNSLNIAKMEIQRLSPIPPVSAEVQALHDYHSSITNGSIIGSTNINQIILTGDLCPYSSPDTPIEILVNGQPYTGMWQPSSSTHLRMLFEPSTIGAFLGTTPNVKSITVRRGPDGPQSAPKFFHVYRSSADVNCQGGVTAEDLLLVLQGIAGLASAPVNCGGFDVDLDGHETIADALHVRRLLAGLTQPYASKKQ